jgi:hypothetical protein
VAVNDAASVMSDNFIAARISVFFGCMAITISIQYELYRAIKTTYMVDITRWIVTMDYAR